MKKVAEDWLTVYQGKQCMCSDSFLGHPRWSWRGGFAKAVLVPLVQQAGSIPLCIQALGGSNSVLSGGEQPPAKACVCFEGDVAS